MATTVIVDDTDPAIHYVGPWSLAGNVAAESNEFNSTVHVANDNSSSLTYEFNGSRISVYCTLDSPASRGIPAATYSLDNFTPTRSNGLNMSEILDVQSHLLLYQSPPLVAGAHTLNISLSNMTSSGPKFYLDFFTVDVASATSPFNVIVDDQNPAISYSGNWTDSHSFNGFLGTDSLADLGGANATFTFIGQAIDVYGVIPPNFDPQTLIDFSIDSGQVTRFTSVPSTTIRRHARLYSISNLSPGSHTLLIQAQNSTRWWLDYLIYAPSSGDSTSSATNGGGGASSNSTGTPTGAIAGGVVGGVLGITLIVALFFLLRRRRKQALGPGALESKQVQSTSSGTRDTRGFLDDGISVITSHVPSGPRFGGVGGRKGGVQRSQATPDRVSTIISDTLPSSTGISVAAPLREIDGGIRLAGSSDYTVPSTLPPSYERH